MKITKEISEEYTAADNLIGHKYSRFFRKGPLGRLFDRSHLLVQIRAYQRKEKDNEEMDRGWMCTVILIGDKIKRAEDIVIRVDDLAVYRTPEIGNAEIEFSSELEGRHYDHLHTVNPYDKVTQIKREKLGTFSFIIPKDELDKIKKGGTSKWEIKVAGDRYYYAFKHRYKLYLDYLVDFAYARPVKELAKRIKKREDLLVSSLVIYLLIGIGLPLALLAFGEQVEEALELPKKSWEKMIIAGGIIALITPIIYFGFIRKRI